MQMLSFLICILVIFNTKDEIDIEKKKKIIEFPLVKGFDDRSVSHGSVWL